MPDQKKPLSDLEKFKKLLDKKTLEKLRGNPDDSEEYRPITNIAPTEVKTNNTPDGMNFDGSYFDGSY
jgi:hypothetical protein